MASAGVPMLSGASALHAANVVPDGGGAFSCTSAQS